MIGVQWRAEGLGCPAQKNFLGNLIKYFYTCVKIKLTTFYVYNSSTKNSDNLFLVISLIFFLISLQSHDLLSDAPLLTSMPSLITFFLLFSPFLSIYLHFLKKTGSLDFYDNDWMPRGRRTSWHPPLCMPL